MTRPKRETVDYFPHNCDHGKTMFILEQRYGNDGYAFWFKLLELLGKNEGHFLDVSDSAGWEYLTSYTRNDDKTCTEILDLLVKLDAIDGELWESKVIWCQKFVDGISDVYKRIRRIEIPCKPDKLTRKPPIGGINSHDNPAKDTLVGINSHDNPQSKVKESKVKESKVDISFIKCQSLSMTRDEYDKLIGLYGKDRVDAKLEYAENYAPLAKKYKSLYRTIGNWLKNDNQKKEPEIPRAYRSIMEVLK